MYLGIDIGGTKTLVASFDDDGTLTEKVKFLTAQEYPAFLKELKQALESLAAKEFSYCGVGMPGITNRSTGVNTWAGGNIAWENSPLGSDVESLANCKVVIENDANMAGLSEANIIKDTYRTAIYLTVSTGIGGVYVVDGVINADTADSEVGHMIYRDGNAYHTWEQLASGKTIVATYGQRAEEITDAEAWKAITEPLAVGLINLSAVLTPDVIIIGGGVGSSLERLKQYLDNWLRQLTPKAVTVPPVVQAKRPEEAVVYGCYELAKQHHGPAA